METRWFAGLPMLGTTPMIAPTTAMTPDATAYIAAVRAAQLVSLPRALEKAVALLPPTATPRQAADAFVRVGLLTRFQAERILTGKTDGFHVGQYVLLEPLGKATTTGRAFKARHRTMNRVVMLTVLTADRTRTSEAREAFHKQARTAAKLAHPNVVTALDANQIGDRHYLVTEYVDGVTLDALVRDRGRLPVSLACEYVRQAAAGLQHAHDRDLPHGRVNPANLIAGQVGGGVGPVERAQVKVLNFGLGKLTQPDTGNLNAAADAVEFLAPEQMNDATRPDAATDRFALGCVLYYLLAGHPPKPATDDVFHQSCGAVPVETLRPDVPATVAAVVRGLMQPEPTARLPLAEAMDLLAPAAAESKVDFALPPVGHGSSGFAEVSGFMPPAQPSEPSPFADLDEGYEVVDGATMETDSTATPITVRRPYSSGGTGVTLAAVLIAAAVIVAAIASVVIVLKAVAR